MRTRSLIPIIYILFLMLPIYWLVAMSSKTTNEILSGFSLFPQTFTLEAYYKRSFTDPTWYWGYINSIIYVSLNTVISVSLSPCPRPMRFPGIGSLATNSCSSGF